MIKDSQIKLCIIFNLLFSHLNIYGGWHVQNPLPTEAILLKIESILDGIIYIGGNGGTLLYTKNNGNTWRIEKISGMDNIRGISFSDSLNGWIIDSNNVQKTKDGGVTWENVDLSIDVSEYYFKDIHSFENTIFVVLTPRTSVVQELINANALILVSKNSGKSWTPNKEIMASKVLSSFFIDENTGFLYCEEYPSVNTSINTFYSTDDGGKTWNRNIFPIQFFTHAIYFFNTDTGFVGNYRTTNNGRVWQDVFDQLIDPSGGEYIETMDFSDSFNGWAISNTSNFYFTEDGGNTWKRSEQNAETYIEDVHFTAEGTGWTIGWGGVIYRMYYDDEKWERVSSGPNNNFNDVFFISNREGWCVGDQGIVLHTIDGGINWSRQNSNTENVLFKVKFINQYVGWVVGYNTVLRTEDGGETWCKVPDLDYYFKDIDFFTTDCGLLIERNGLVFKTDDSGNSWNIITEVPISPRLTSIEIMNQDEALIGGFGGLAYTNDRGLTLSWYEFPSFYLVEDIQIIFDHYGWLRNEMGELWETYNNGMDWTVVQKDDSFDQNYSYIKTFHLFDRVNAWIYQESRYASIAYSSYGESLHKEDKYYVHFINAFSFFDRYTGWAVGDYGTILKYEELNSYNKVSDHRLSLFPNPFHQDGVYLKFTLKDDQHVTISIFNVLSQEICKPYNYWMLKGEKKLFWQPKDISSGIYLIGIYCQEFTEIRKCTFLRN